MSYDVIWAIRAGQMTDTARVRVGVPGGYGVGTGWHVTDSATNNYCISPLLWCDHLLKQCNNCASFFDPSISNTHPKQ